MVGTFLKSKTDETTGITTFIYSLIGTEEELRDYSLLKGSYYGVVGGKPVYSSPWYFGIDECFGKHLKKGYYFPYQQLFGPMKAHTDQFGGNPYKMLSDSLKDKNWLLYEKNLMLIEDGKRRKSNETKKQVKEAIKTTSRILSSDKVNRITKDAKSKTKEQTDKEFDDGIGETEIVVLSSDELQKANEEAKTQSKESIDKEWLDGLGAGDKLNQTIPESSPIESGNYVNGKKHGLWHWNCYDNSNNGTIEGTIIYYEDNELESTYRGYDPDKRLVAETYFLNGVRHGNWKSYFNGQITEDSNYLYGILHGYSTSYEEGRLVDRGSYFLGEKEGEWEEVYQDMEFIDLHDSGYGYNVERDRTEKGNYINGEKDGKWETQYHTGYIAFSYFKNGHIANEKGQMINKWGRLVNEDGDRIDEDGNLLQDHNSLEENYYNNNPDDFD